MNTIKIISIKDTEYPSILKEIHSPPKILYWRGNIDILKKRPMIAIVGTRRCSSYGKQATQNIAEGLARAGVVIVSGMARGIDTAAHEAVLNVSGITIAVLGSGIDDESIYPQQNVKLAKRIIDSGGLVISEYKPGIKGLAWNFPERNRIVAGLSEGTVVVEAPYKSGSMITARLALDSGRDVYAVPGSIFSRLSQAPNFLIKQGAHSARGAEDILENLGIKNDLNLNQNIKEENLPPNSRKIYEIIRTSAEALHIDTLHARTKLPFDTLSECVATLMLEDFVTETEPNRYIAR